MMWQGCQADLGATLPGVNALDTATNAFDCAGAFIASQPMPRLQTIRAVLAMAWGFAARAARLGKPANIAITGFIVKPINIIITITQNVSSAAHMRQHRKRGVGFRAVHWCENPLINRAVFVG